MKFKGKSYSFNTQSRHNYLTYWERPVEEETFVNSSRLLIKALQKLNLQSSTWD